MAEEIVYGEDEVTTGASNDLQQVAQVARQMITRFGRVTNLVQWPWADRRGDVPGS